MVYVKTCHTNQSFMAQRLSNHISYYIAAKMGIFLAPKKQYLAQFLEVCNYAIDHTYGIYCCWISLGPTNPRGGAVRVSPNMCTEDRYG